MGILKIVLDAGPQITDVDVGVWASVVVFVMMVAVALLCWSFYRRYKKASMKIELDEMIEGNHSHEK